MTTTEQYIERRKAWAAAAAADETFKDEKKRCKGALARRRPGSHLLHHCYVGIAYGLTPGSRWIEPVGAVGYLVSVQPEGASRIVRNYYGLSSTDVTGLIGLSDAGTSVEDLNRTMLQMTILPRRNHKEDTDRA